MQRSAAYLIGMGTFRRHMHACIRAGVTACCVCHQCHYHYQSGSIADWVDQKEGKAKWGFIILGRMT